MFIISISILFTISILYIYFTISLLYIYLLLYYYIFYFIYILLYQYFIPFWFECVALVFESSVRRVCFELASSNIEIDDLFTGKF